MSRLLIVVALLLCLPQHVLAGETNTNEHLLEIDRLSKLISEKTFEPMETVVEGENLSEALSKAVGVVSEHINLKAISPEISTHNTLIIPVEQLALLESLGYTLTETTSGETKRVTLLISLESRQLKQLALFEMWPLFGQEFVQKSST